LVVRGAAAGSVAVRDRNDTDSATSDRFAQIQAAIRRGEERAARRTAGESLEEDDQEAPPPQLTPETEQLLRQFIVTPDGLGLGDDGADWPGNVEGEEQEEGLRVSPGSGPVIVDMAGPQEEERAAVESRIRKTLEFCPDGRLAHEILRELQAEGAPVGAAAFDLVIGALSDRGALDDALVVFNEMQEASVPPTNATWDALARPAARGGQYNFVERLYQAKASDCGGDIGEASLALLLEAYANGLPRQAGRAEAAFRGAMATAEEAAVTPQQAAPSKVLRSLRRAVGAGSFKDLCREYGLADPDGEDTDLGEELDDGTDLD